MAKTLQDLIDEYNAKSGKAPIKSWKQKRAVLEERLAKLDGAVPVEPTQETVEQPAETVETPKEKKVATKKAKTAKKTAKKAKTNGNGAATREGTLKQYVLDMHAKGKGNADILEAAAAKGFKTSYGTVASIRSRYGK